MFGLGESGSRGAAARRGRAAHGRSGRLRGSLLATTMLLPLASLWPPAATAAPTVTEFTGGVTPGFSANRVPTGITTGPDGNIWFTEFGSPGALGRVNPNLSVTEFTGGVTAGFSANRQPFGSRPARTATSGSPSRRTRARWDGPIRTSA